MIGSCKNWCAGFHDLLAAHLLLAIIAKAVNPSQQSCEMERSRGNALSNNKFLLSLHRHCCKVANILTRIFLCVFYCFIEY